MVARNIRRLRVARALSQEMLAVDAGIDRTYVSRLERGLDNPTVTVLEKLARALSSNIKELFRVSREGETAPRPLKGGRREKQKEKPVSQPPRRKALTPSFRDASPGAGPESILPVVVMDSGLARSLSSGRALRGPVGAPRNDAERTSALSHLRSPFTARKTQSWR
jgi:transcriptional regulator with XRE-family HTH domain